MLWHDRIRGCTDQLFGRRDRSLHALGGRRQNDFGAKKRQHLATFDRHRFRHHQLQPVSARRGDKSQGDTGIARSRFDQHGVRVDHAGFLHRHHHCRPNTVLNAGGRTEIFQLREDDSVGAMRGGQIPQPNYRGIAYRVDDTVEYTATAARVHCTRR